MLRASIAVEKCMPGGVLSHIYLTSPISDWDTSFCSDFCGVLDVGGLNWEFIDNGLEMQSDMSALKRDLSLSAG